MKKPAPVLFISSLLTILALFVAPSQAAAYTAKGITNSTGLAYDDVYGVVNNRAIMKTNSGSIDLSTPMAPSNEQQRTAPVGILTTRRLGTTHWNPRSPPSATVTSRFRTPKPTMATHFRAVWQMQRRAKSFLPLTKPRPTSRSRPMEADM